uniref:Uncharacterized protein n=1 Tax=Siphoviridae sp. ctxMM9 TaxID=2827973 RepID=A0A8S5T735_9CAUD|nr:MAG TPA: hypothetical protein [Siphoviridae sp. ctxMM9]
MAKVSLSKITPVRDIKTVTININGQDIEVAQYLPVAKKAELIETVLNQTLDDTGFLNPTKMEISFTIQVIKYYTSISITEKMIEDSAKTYDLLIMNGIIDAIVNAIPKDEYDSLFDTVEEAAKHTVSYMTSFAGMMKSASEDYKNTEMNVDKLVETLKDPEQIGFVKAVLDKMG